MKTIIALASLAFLSTAAFALDPGCNPVVANWQNASPQTCAVSDDGGQKHYFTPATHEDDKS